MDFCMRNKQRSKKVLIGFTESKFKLFNKIKLTVEEEGGGWVVIWLADGYSWTVNTWVTSCKMDQREENNPRESSQARGEV
jgi:hypothetical protein